MNAARTRERGRIEAVCIHRMRKQPKTVSFEDLPHALIARVFERDSVTRLEKNTGCETQRLLRAVDNDESLR